MGFFLFKNRNLYLFIGDSLSKERKISRILKDDF